MTTQHHPTASPRIHRAPGLVLLAVSVLMTPITSAHAAAKLCTTRYSDELENVSPTGATFIAVSAFQLDCQGGIHGSLNVTSGRLSDTQLQLERKLDGQWTVVERGHTLSHHAQPGTYRMSVAQTSKKGSFCTWTLRYSKPLP